MASTLESECSTYIPLAELVDHVIREKHSTTQGDNVLKPPLPPGTHESPPTSPSGRTGPPRSLSFSLSNPHINLKNSAFGDGYFPSPDLMEDEDYVVSNLEGQGFRTALEIGSQSPVDRKGKRREGSLWDGGWPIHPSQWFPESPSDE